jgi:large repetitive protein
MAHHGKLLVQPLRSASRAMIALCLLVASLAWVAPTSALTLDTFAPRFEGNVAGDFALTGNTVLSCSTVPGNAGASTCSSARRRVGTSLDNDDHFMRNLEVPVGGLPAADVFNSSANTLEIPDDARILYAELFWSGSLLQEEGDIAPLSPAKKNEVLFAVGSQGCAQPNHPCLITAQSSDVVQEMLGSDPGQYRASAVVTPALQKARWQSARDTWQSLITVGNIQTAQGADKAAGWSLAVVYASAGHSMRHVQVLGGFGVIARRSGATVPLDGFLTPSTGDVASSVGVVAFDGDLGDATDSMYLRQDSGQTLIQDAQNPELNIANSTVASGGTLSAHLTDVSPESSSNTFGVDADRVDLTNALAHGSTSATLVMSSQQDTWYPVSLAYSTELPSADVALEKFVSDVSGAPATEVNVGDTLTYTIRASNVGNGSARQLIIRDDVPVDLTVTSSSGTDCATVPLGHVCKVIDALGAGASAEVTVTGIVNGTSQIEPGNFTNQADVTYTSHLGDNTAVSNIVTTEYGPLAVDLASELSFADDYIQAGDSATLTGTITNLGPIDDDNPSVDLLITEGVATPATMPAGCEKVTPTHLKCSAEAFGVSVAQPLAPGETKGLSLHLRPRPDSSQLVMKQVVHTGVVVGDSNPNNNISYAQADVNHPPVAKPLFIKVRAGGPSVTTSLGTHVSDPDNDALHILVAHASHGTLIQLGTRIRFMPPKNWNGTERVNYAVEDGKGGQTQSHITIAITAPSVIDNGWPDKPTTPHRKCVVIRSGC